jgi:hypothetical protein
MMPQLLPKEHTILERPVMEFQPFGVTKQGEKIYDISGALVKGKLEYLEASVGKLEGAQAGAQVPHELCRLLNERIPDPIFHVTPAFLRNSWHSYSYEFISYFRLFCAQLAGNPPNYHFNSAREKQIPPSIAVLAKPFPTSQIFQMFPFFGDKYARGLVKCEVGPVTHCSAILRLKLTERAIRQVGAYLRSCADISCQTTKGLLSSVPERIHGLPAAVIRDRTCMADGDEWCEWEITWQPDSGRGILASLLSWVTGGGKHRS